MVREQELRHLAADLQVTSISMPPPSPQQPQGEEQQQVLPASWGAVESGFTTPPP